MPIEYVTSPVGLKIYIQLTWLFTIVITILMLLICYLYLSMRKALERERFSLTFSDLAIEGMETERRRISRELHDIVLPQIRDQPVAVLIKTICLDLMPPDFNKYTLKDALADACQKLTKRSGIECACFIEEELDFSPIRAENQLHLYRMVQEALTNIEKHSKTQRASLVVRNYTRDSLENIMICVSDDGIGMSSSSESGLGLRSLDQRAAILGARLDFSSESGNGLMVRIELPLPLNTK